MARITSGTAQEQQCLKEQIEKEEGAALRFFLKTLNWPKAPYGSSVLRKKLERIQLDDSECRKVLAEVKRRNENRCLAEEQRKKVIKPVMTPEVLPEQLNMRPPSPSTKALLYEGTSHEGRGR
ncbi:unnamed protein product [Echinostoma caproni]|uniref:Sperm microtubule inner protein 1 C-terminal domain-containing protein n=1 Tax=Echinostoma caproni TaxID=27848 RepID=A0A183A1P5_9TREM|nr:unnamed protein product [Echinostoma caproni]